MTNACHIRAGNGVPQSKTVFACSNLHNVKAEEDCIVRVHSFLGMTFLETRVVVELTVCALCVCMLSV